MKKAISLLLALVLCLSLCACGGNNKELEKYKKYETLINYLEAEDYENAYYELLKISMGGDTADTTPDAEGKETTTIEINLDNWQEYFEIVLVVAEVARNDFDEFTGFTPGWRFCLKEQYAEIATEIDIAVEYSCTNGYFCTYSYNLDTEELVVGEPDINDPADDSTKTFTLNHPSRQGYITTWVQGGIDQTVIEGNIATIKASLYENMDILRIQGSLTIIK